MGCSKHTGNRKRRALYTREDKVQVQEVREGGVFVKIVIHGNTVNLYDSCRKDYETCDSYWIHHDYIESDTGDICCCTKYEPKDGKDD